MSILINKTTRVIVQGITGHHGSFHAAAMLQYGTKVVAGVTPGKGGQTVRSGGEKIPVFNSVSEAVKKYPAEWSIIFVPAPHAMDAAMEALSVGLNIVIITEHMPIRDVIDVQLESQRVGKIFIGPNCPGIITPGECKIGIMPGDVFLPGNVGVLSRSGTLTYEIVAHMSASNIGQSTVIGIGGDFVNGLNFIEGLKMFAKDDATKAVVIVGEIGGAGEEKVAEYILKAKFTKPVVAFVAGRTAPPGKTMGHAGAIVSGNTGSFTSKINAFRKASVPVATSPSKVSVLLKKFL